jgi:hypothetical protein
MSTRPRAGDVVITKASLQGIHAALKEEAISSEVVNIASEVIDAANAHETSITYDLGLASKQGKWHSYAHDQYTKYITSHYVPTPDEVLSRLRAKFPDSNVSSVELDGRVSVTIDWS